MRLALPLMLSMTLAACGAPTPRGGNGPIARACLQSDRSAANPRLCACIQRVANDDLSRADQERAAVFFRAPDQAQETRTRTDAGSNAFWRRYKDFAAAAGRRCG